MKPLFTLLLSFFFFQSIFSQQLLKDTTTSAFVMVDSFPTCINCFIIDPDKIRSINILKGNHATSLFGEKAKQGAILVSMQETVKLSRLKDIFDAFNFPDSIRKLRVCIDDKIIFNPELTIADLNEIVSIGTFTSVDYSIDANCSLNMKEEKLINITSKKR